MTEHYNCSCWDETIYKGPTCKESCVQVGQRASPLPPFPPSPLPPLPLKLLSLSLFLPRSSSRSPRLEAAYFAQQWIGVGIN